MATGYLKFSSGLTSYVYDKSTNGCIPIDDTTAHILDDFLIYGTDAVLQRFVGIADPAVLGNSITFLQELKNGHGFFRELQPIVQTSAFSEQNLAEILDSTCRHLTLNITEACNLRCRYCVYGGEFTEERTHSAKTMSWSVARKSIDYFLAKKCSDQRLTFYGGEPLLNWELAKFCIEYVRNSKEARDVTVNMVTNLTVLTEEQACFLISNDIHLHISLDGPEAVNDAARIFQHGAGTHKRVVGNILLLKKLSPEYCATRLLIKCTFNENNSLSDIFSYFSLAPFIDLDVSISAVRKPDGEVGQDQTRELAGWHHELDSLISEYHKDVQAGIPRNHRLFQRLFSYVFTTVACRPITVASSAELMNRLCIPGGNGIFVNTDGRFYTCENFSQADFCIGSVDDGIHLNAVKKLVDDYTRFCSDLCHHCWASRLCSLCYLHTLDNGRFSKEQLELNCERERNRIARAFERFIFVWNIEPTSFYAHEFSLHAAVERR